MRERGLDFDICSNSEHAKFQKKSEIWVKHGKHGKYYITWFMSEKLTTMNVLTSILFSSGSCQNTTSMYWPKINYRDHQILKSRCVQDVCAVVKNPAGFPKWGCLEEGITWTKWAIAAWKLSNQRFWSLRDVGRWRGGRGGGGGRGVEHGGQANCLRVWKDPPTRGNPSLTYKIFKYIIVNLDYKILKVDLARGMKWYSIARGRAMNRYSINIFNKYG